MGPGLNLGSADWRDEMWVEIFDRAIKKKKVVNAKLGQHEIQYALINPKDGYGRITVSADGGGYLHNGSVVTFWIKDAEKEGRVGMTQGGLAFVLERSLPRPDFADYIGLHEFAEANFKSDSGAVKNYTKTVHGHGCKTELEEILKKEPEFIDAYSNWLVESARKSKYPERTYFGRAIPEFLPLIKEGRLSPTELVKEFKRQLDSGYNLK